MSLRDVREWFVKESGRYDLLYDVATFGDGGADRYINAGARWLDRQVTMLNQWGKVFRTLGAGEYLLELSACRTIDVVDVRKSDGEIVRLSRRTFGEIRERFREDISEITNAEPQYYTLDSLREHDAQEADPPDTEGITSSSWRTRVGLLILPPPTEEVTIIVEGKFFTSELTSDEDENFWSANEPSVLVKAGLRELESFYRNTAGVQDWTNSIMQDLVGIEKDFIEKSFGYIDKLEG